MKTCEEYRALFDAYMARELTRMERMELEAHIEQCSECAKLLSEQEKLFGEEIYTMPASVRDTVMERVNASVVGDMFTNEEERESIEIAVRKQLRKRDGIKSWVLIAIVILFAVGYYFLQDYMLGRNPALGGMDSAPKEEAATEEIVVGDDETEETKGQSAPVSDVLSTLREYLVAADKLTIKFGTTKAIIYEHFEIEYLADYIVSCPIEKIEGRVNYKSVGSITPSPDHGVNLHIADNHKIILSMGSDIYEIQTEREDLLYALQGVGILS